MLPVDSVLHKLRPDPDCIREGGQSLGSVFAIDILVAGIVICVLMQMQ